MGWSWKIARLAGIDVHMHVTFLILVAWVGAVHYMQRKSLVDAAFGVVFILLLFVIVVLHELGHALTARRFGIATRDITLLPIGGVARLERMPDDPRQELLVALAGPAVNVVLAVVFGALLAARDGAAAFARFEVLGANDLLVSLFWINVMLALFNMLPAFPMDGGRVLRALLALRMDYLKATQIAATVGQGMAVLFGFVGLFGNVFLLFIALFVWVGAAGEASMAQIKHALGGIPVHRAMITDFDVLRPDDPLDAGVRHMLAGFQQDFPVVDEQGRLVGVLTRDALMRALAERGGEAPVSGAMTTAYRTVDPNDMLESAFLRLQSGDSRAMPVVRGDELVGLLTSENVGEFMMVHAAAHGVTRPTRPG